MPAERLVKLPDSIDYKTAAAMMLQGMTVRYLLRETYKVGKGTTLLFHAAAGGVGLIACQWAHHLGATVIGTVSTPAKAELAKAHGCTHVINYKTEDFVKRTKELTNGQGVDVVYDAVGKDTYPGSLDCLKPLGLWVSFGNASGAITNFDILQLSAKGSLYATRPTLGTYIAKRADLLANANELFDVVSKGIVKINVNHTYPLKDAVQAHKRPGRPQNHRFHRPFALASCRTKGAGSARVLLLPAHVFFEVHRMAQKPIELHYWPTPNGHKITILLRGSGRSLRDQAGQHRQGRSIQARVSGHRAQQPHAGDHRSRWSRRQADLDLRIGRHPAVPRAQDRQILSERGAGPCRGRAVALLADGQPRSQLRSGAPFPQLCAGEGPLRHRSLHQRGEPALRRDGYAAQGSADFSPATIRSPTWRAIPGCGPTRTKARTSPSSRTSRNGSSACTTAPRLPRPSGLARSCASNYNLATDKDAQNVLFGQRARR